MAVANMRATNPMANKKRILIVLVLLQGMKKATKAMKGSDRAFSVTERWKTVFLKVGCHTCIENWNIDFDPLLFTPNFLDLTDVTPLIFFSGKVN